MSNKDFSVVISGKFDKPTLPRILAATGELRGLGYIVLAPIFKTVSDLEGSFPILDTDDRSKSPRELEQAFLKNLGMAALHVVISREDGRVGRSTAAERAYAAVHGIPSVVLASPRQPADNTPGVWFTEDLGADERAALSALPWPTVDLDHEQAAPTLAAIIGKDQAVPEEHPNYGTLVGIYESLLRGLSDIPPNDR